MNLTDFINAAEERWHDIPATNLEASNRGRLRNIITKAMFGEIKYLEDLDGILSGAIPIWSKESVIPTPNPSWFFKHRNRHEKDDTQEILYDRAA